MTSPGPSVAAYVPAKGHSRGVPGKNIAPLLGRPLLEYTLDVARRCQTIDHVFVSTESNQVAAVAEPFGVRLLHRPDHLAADDVSADDVLIHELDEIEMVIGPDGVIVMLLPTSPLRLPTVVDTGVKRFIAGGGQTTLRSVRRYETAVNLALDRDPAAEGRVSYHFDPQLVTFRQAMPVYFHSDGYYSITSVRNVRLTGAVHHPSGDQSVDLTDEINIDVDEPRDLVMAGLVILGLNAAGRWDGPPPLAQDPFSPVGPS